MMEFDIKFVGENPNEVIYQKVYDDLLPIYEDLEGHPEKLLYHVVFLSEDHEGPTVFCWGDPNEPGVFMCEYREKTEWVSLSDLGDHMD